MKYEAVIGLEVHVQLAALSKLFCPCVNAFGAAANTHVCPVCLGHPGAMPALNAEAVRLAVRASLALSCTLRTTSVFSRKHYFYPDLPKGYQITQFDKPLAEHGVVRFGDRSVRVARLHMEEDAGKSVHDAHHSNVDLNRAGVPLVEIVTAPDLRSPEEAASYLKALRELLMACGVTGGDMEEGNFRFDANISLRVQDQKLGVRVELKNLNSFRHVERGLSFEIARQRALLDGGGAVMRETRGFDEKTGETFAMRSKEESRDYRYMDEPDLPALVLDDALVQAESLRVASFELPERRFARYVTLGLSEPVAHALTQHPEISAYFERVAVLSQAWLRSANFIATEVLGGAVLEGLRASFPVTETTLSALLSLCERGTLTGKQGKEAYAELTRSARPLEEIIASKGWGVKLSDTALQDAVAAALALHPSQVASYRAGKTMVLGFFVGQVMKATEKAGDPERARALLVEALEHTRGGN
jgi:aspartyl-tRNA(Asn)/glutamyl-tRNA(Gln) amidotransferase subunit B